MSVWLQEARSYPNGVVATPHYLATAAGAAMLAGGGNAVDAALAANLVLGVVTPYMCGFGGDLLTMVWDGRVNAYRGVGRAPAESTAAGVRAQSGETAMPVFGPHPITVPGAAIAARIQEAGGFMTDADLAAHEGAWVEPLRAEVRGTEILEMPPPTQGMTALEALRIVDGFALDGDGPDREHLLIEAVKSALADRQAYLGDPDAMRVRPETILADDWIAHRRASHQPRQAP